MKKIRLSCTSTYDIVIGKSVLAKLGSLLGKQKKGRKALVVSNPKVAKLYLASVRKSLKAKGFDVYEVRTPYGSERDKSEKVLLSLWNKMAAIPLERGSLVVALGGGVIGDLAGFAASTYMRGVSVVQVPTTLLAQVDSAVGGKTAIDLKAAKNIIGAFHQPSLVLSDVQTLKSLPFAFLRDSMAEVIKYGVIEDITLFKLLEKQGPSVFKRLKQRKWNAKDAAFLEQIVWRSARVKANVVAADEFEKKGKRVMLNLGHTFAHGFEAASNFRLSHGAAVAIGMACAARLAVLLKMMKASDEQRLLQLINALGLSDSIRGLRLPMKQVMDAMQRDKKKKAGKIRFVLPTRIGKTVVKENIPNSLVLKAIQTSGLKG